MNKTYRGAFPTLVVLLGAIGIVQWHSILFWSVHINPAIGWLWSVALEASALWLWYQRSWVLGALGLIASLLLLVGPLYQIASPILDAGREAKHADVARLKLIEQSQAAVASAEAQLEAVLANSKAAPRWSRHEWISAIEGA